MQLSNTKLKKYSMSLAMREIKIKLAFEIPSQPCQNDCQENK